MKENILIIGGTAHTMKMLCEYNYYNIEDITYYTENEKYGNYDWSYLDIQDLNTINLFLNKIKNKKYDKIICAIGNSFNKNEFNINDLKLFYESYLINYIYLINFLFLKLNLNGQIIFISSVGSQIPIKDAHYSVTKAGLEAFIRSKSISLEKDKTCYSISPSTISNTVAEEICKIIMKSNNNNGKTIKVGWQ